MGGVVHHQLNPKSPRRCHRLEGFLGSLLDVLVEVHVKRHLDQARKFGRMGQSIQKRHAWMRGDLQQCWRPGVRQFTLDAPELRDRLIADEISVNEAQPRVAQRT